MSGKRVLGLVVVILSLLLGLSALQGGQGLPFTRQNLKVNGEIIGKISEDLDGDNLVDLILFYLEGEDENSRKMVGFFKQQKDLGFDTIPQQIFRLDEKASVVDLADIDKDGTKELLFLTEDGVYYYSLEGGVLSSEPSLLITAANFLTSPENSIMLWDFCLDWGDDKDNLLLIPQRKGYDVWRGSQQGGFERKARLRFKPDISLRASPGELRQDRGLIGFSYNIPGLVLADYNGDGEDDMLMLQKDKIYVFLPKEDGDHGEQADKVISLKSKNKEDNPEIKLEDINGDGIVDLILNESKGDLEKGSKTKISIYLGKKGDGFDLDTPHQTISSEKEASDVSFCDLDDDGKKEMIMPSYGFSLGSVVKMLLSKSLKFNLYIRSLGKENTYPDRPNREMKLSVKVSLSGSGDEDNQALEFSGDFNGDGLGDLFFASGDNILKFFLGRRGDFFADKPQYEMGIEVPAGRSMIIDLNKDDKSDMIISFGKERGELKGKVVVLFSNM